MPSRRTPKRRTTSSFDLYAQAMLDHWLGKKDVVEVERDDGYHSRSLVRAVVPPPLKGSKIATEAVPEVRSRPLGVGCGPGRHAACHHRTGHAAVAIAA